ncbi:single-stranded DNA-binding protein [Flavobacterium sp. Sd200]|uniref:single-stranded DNA-binding protein n=1 Tax=Flavobacterium sp. Sd200 TaxID=2692211 RepID=UPI001368952B|nr:single-stranded DNA-binding protein [Flavobacterium sp. Sd200]MXN91118.1 single-stranded DNA-binding protein [Flavobacterium sp. Sd200]
MNIIGRLTRDAQVRNVSEEQQVVNFSVALNESYRNKEGERTDIVTYVDCAYWRTTKIAQYLTKGKLVELSGRISPRAWVDTDGQLRAALNFRTSEIKFHGGGKKEEGAEASTKPKNSKAVAPERSAADNDDLPF